MRRNTIGFWAFAVLVFGLMPARGASAQTQIVAFGTSFTAGYGVGQYAAYPALLEQALKEKGYSVVVRIAGANLDTAKGGLARVDSAVPTGTALALVEFGVNEIKGSNGSVDDIGPSLKAIAANLHSRGIKTIFVSLRGASRYMRGLGGPVVDMALKNDIDPATQHPNAAGHAIAARQLLPVVMSALGKPKR
jgi:acyl-CoA thioesterase-1